MADTGVPEFADDAPALWAAVAPPEVLLGAAPPAVTTAVTLFVYVGAEAIDLGARRVDGDEILNFCGVGSPYCELARVVVDADVGPGEEVTSKTYDIVRVVALQDDHREIRLGAVGLECSGLLVAGDVWTDELGIIDADGEAGCKLEGNIALKSAQSDQSIRQSSFTRYMRGWWCLGRNMMRLEITSRQLETLTKSGSRRSACYTSSSPVSALLSTHL